MDTKERAAHLRRQITTVNLSGHRPTGIKTGKIPPGDTTLQKRFAQQQKEAAENPDYVNFNNRFDLYHFKPEGDFSTLPGEVFSFDSQTDFSQTKLPANFNPDQFMENGKDPGLGVKDLHQQGITGKGIKIAIIDQPLADHQEYHGKIKHYEEVGFANKNEHGAMHGSCVTSLAVGNDCGLAPDAEVYYFAAPFWDFEKKQDTKVHVAEALKKCIELNRTLPPGEKISAVSISGCFDSSMDGYKDYKKLREEAAKDGLEVITCSIYKEKGLSMNGYNRDMTQDVNQDNNVIPIKGRIDNRIQKDWFSPNQDQTLLLPCDHRTMASESGYDQYMHAARGGFSWLPPQAVGMYALAKQADPSCSFDHMWETGLKTGLKNENGVALNPQKLIKSLQQERLLKQEQLKSQQAGR